MKKNLLVLYSILLIQLPLFSQAASINGPDKVCPNTVYTYSLAGVTCSNSSFVVDWTPAPVTIHETGANFIRVSFPDYDGGLRFRVTVNWSCSATDNGIMSKTMTVTSMGQNEILNHPVDCSVSGSTLFERSIPNVADLNTITWTTNTGWPLLNSDASELSPSGGRMLKGTFNVNNFNSGYVKATMKSQCVNAPDYSITFNVTRPPSGLPAPIMVNTPDYFCIGSSSTASIQAISGATSYTWTSSLPALTINGQTGPVVTTSPTVNLNWNSPPGGSGQATLSVTGQLTCGNTPAAEMTINGGAPNQYISVAPFLDYTPEEYCTNCILQFQLTSMSPLIGVTGYQWKYQLADLPPVITSENGTHLAIVLWEAGNYVITATPFNSCGLGFGYSLPVTIIDPFSTFNFRLVSYPNPSNGVINIMLLEKSRGKTKQPDVPVEVRIYDYNYNLHKTYKAEKGQRNFQIGTGGVKPGKYLLQIIAGKEKSTQHIVIQ